MRFFLLFAFTLCAAAAEAQTQLQTQPQAVPSRSLLAEMTLAEQGGAPASVHTHSAIGSGLFVDADTVVVARHTVLTPSGEIALDIGVGTSRLPLNNIMESRSVAIAQDPEHDLVLLHLLGDGLPAAALPASRSTSTSCPPRVARAHVRLHHARRKHSSRAERGPGARLLQTRAGMEAPVRLRIVWDGPLAHSR